MTNTTIKVDDFEKLKEEIESFLYNEEIKSEIAYNSDSNFDSNFDSEKQDKSFNLGKWVESIRIKNEVKNILLKHTVYISKQIIPELLTEAYRGDIIE